MPYAFPCGLCLSRPYQALELYPHNPMLLALRLRLGAVARSRCALRRDLGSLAAGVMKAAVATLEGLAREAEPGDHATKGAQLIN